MTAHRLEQAEQAWEVIERLAAGAASAGARLLVLPECSYPAYWLESAARFRQSARQTTKQVLSRLGHIAAAHGLHLVCGIVEEADDLLFNAAAVFDPRGGLLGMARKTFLWDCDNRWFTPGEQTSVFETELGRIGVQICADARAPETTACLAAQGAELVAMPTAWVNVSRVPGELHNIQPEFLIESRSREFSLPFVCADKFGAEAPMQYVGRSLITNERGEIMTQAPAVGEMLIVADIVPTVARRTVLSQAQREALVVDGCQHKRANHSERLCITHDAFAAGTARTATVDGSDARSFVDIRLLALAGVQVVCINNAVDPATLRARAAENRVFVLARMARESLIIAPDGGIIRRAALSESNTAEVSLGDADEKCFTPETDLWRQRRTSARQLAGA